VLGTIEDFAVDGSIYRIASETPRPGVAEAPAALLRPA
jgi:hypothetical protein